MAFQPSHDIRRDNGPVAFDANASQVEIQYHLGAFWLEAFSAELRVNVSNGRREKHV